MRNVLRGRGQQILAAFLMGLILALLVGTQAGSAAGPDEPPDIVYPPGSIPIRPNWVGYDISWPQCDGSIPAETPHFAIVGVTGGRPFTANPCLAEEYRWAESGEYPAEVYINLDYWRRLSFRHFFGPAGLCGPQDSWCQAYNYGWNSAKYAVDLGEAQGVDARRWWLDVETMNHWSDDVRLNARIIGGALDYLASNGLTTGIYSTAYQWRVIAGGYAPGGPIWVAGASNLLDAVARCSDARYAFAGGRVELVQWVETYDRNFACP